MSGRPLVVGSDPTVLRLVLAVAAAATVESELVAQPVDAVRSWRGAPLVVVTPDGAEALARIGLPRRGDVFLVGAPTDRSELDRWSGPLGAAVVLLPDGAEWLTTVFADVAGRAAATGRVLALIGGSGGVGVSSLAAAVAVGAAVRGASSLLVDLDPDGGGLDLLMGAEDRPGWRWPRLLGARGHVADLTDHLPRAADVTVLSADRGASGPDETPSAPAVRSVLTSAARLQQVIVVDLPRAAGPAADEALRCSDRIVVLTAAEVRGITATRRLIDRLLADGHDPALVVRRSRGTLPAERVADALGLPLLGVCPDDPGVRRSEAAGEPPGRIRRSPIARSAASILEEQIAAPSTARGSRRGARA